MVKTTHKSATNNVAALLDLMGPRYPDIISRADSGRYGANFETDLLQLADDVAAFLNVGKQLTPGRIETLTKLKEDLAAAKNFRPRRGKPALHPFTRAAHRISAVVVEFIEPVSDKGQVHELRDGPLRRFEAAQIISLLYC